MPTFREIEVESLKVRARLETCNKAQMELVTPDFPVMNCKLSSMLLAYHFLIIWPRTKITGIGGVTKNRRGHDSISHYWLEMGSYCIDITSDQYNIISSEDLNEEIVSGRPYNPVYIGIKGCGHLYKHFRVSYREEHEDGFPQIAEEFLEKMELDYVQIFGKALYA